MDTAYCRGFEGVHLLQRLRGFIGHHWVVSHSLARLQWGLGFFPYRGRASNQISCWESLGSSQPEVLSTALSGFAAQTLVWVRIKIIDWYEIRSLEQAWLD